MSTRCNIKITGPGTPQTLYLYRHHDGYLSETGRHITELLSRKFCEWDRSTVGVAKRLLKCCYEAETHNPSVQLLPKLAKVLATSTDELLGIESTPSQPVDLDVRLVRKVQQIQKLPPATRRTVLKVIDNFLVAEGINDDAA